MTDETKRCFVISPIGMNGSDIRKRADQVLKHILKPAAEECGFTAIRADELSEPGMITDQVIQHIIDDPLVIADLSGLNPNVFYELAIRHAIRKPLVQIVQKGERIPFDVAGMRTITVDHTDLDSVEDAKMEIIKQITAIVKKKTGEIESPISVSLELQALRHSEKPEDRSYAELLAAMSDLRSEVSSSFVNIKKLLPTNRDLLLMREIDEMQIERGMLMSKINVHLSHLRALSEVDWRSIADYQKEVEMVLIDLENLGYRSSKRLERGLG